MCWPAECQPASHQLKRLSDCSFSAYRIWRMTHYLCMLNFSAAVISFVNSDKHWTFFFLKSRNLRHLTVKKKIPQDICNKSQQPGFPWFLPFKIRSNIWLQLIIILVILPDGYKHITTYFLMTQKVSWLVQVKLATETDLTFSIINILSFLSKRLNTMRYSFFLCISYRCFSPLYVKYYINTMQKEYFTMTNFNIRPSSSQGFKPIWACFVFPVTGNYFQEKLIVYSLSSTKH